MSVVSDETLMAYADGALAPAEREAVEAAIRRHPDYLRKVEQFRATLRPIQDLFRDAVHAEDLQPLADRIRRSGAADAGTRVSRLPVRRPALQPYSPLAMAASVALLIGAALGWFLHPQAEIAGTAQASFIQISDGSLTAQGALRDLLERTPKDNPVKALADGGRTWELEAASTFRSLSQQHCRRYEVRNETVGRFGGYACRDGQGQWTVRAHARLETPSNGQGMAPASGPGMDDADAALDAAIAAVSDGKVYPDAEERALIGRGWAD